MTDDTKIDEWLFTFGTDLGRATTIAVSAVAEFFAALDGAACDDVDRYKSAYDGLRDTLSGRVTGNESLMLLAGERIAVRARMAYEKTRRPDGYVNREKPGTNEFNVAEALLNAAGKPVTYAKMSEIYAEGRNYRLKLAGTTAAKIVVDLANANPGLVPVKTKVDGKAAYLLRPGDEKPLGFSGLWGVYDLKEE